MKNVSKLPWRKIWIIIVIIFYIALTVFFVWPKPDLNYPFTVLVVSTSLVFRISFDILRFNKPKVSEEFVYTFAKDNLQYIPVAMGAAFSGLFKLPLWQYVIIYAVFFWVTFTVEKRIFKRAGLIK